MINTGDYVLVYRDDHAYFMGMAGYIRGFDQRHIVIYCSNDWGFPVIEVDRQTGLDKNPKIKLRAEVVTKEAWEIAREKKRLQEIENGLKMEAEKLLKQSEEDALIAKAEAWYETLPNDQKEMVKAICYSRRPIIVG